MLFFLLACAGKPEPADSGTPPCEPRIWTLDLDGDGWAGTTTVEACEAPPQSVSEEGDCQDEDPSVHPDAEEICDGVDNDCDGVLDPPGTAWFADVDGDGYGDPTLMMEACARPEGTVSDDTDCDDSRADVYPSAVEVWYDGVDQDCAGDSDHDADGDGHDTVDAGGGDCMDEEASVHPDAEEVCLNGVDDDCDGAWDECALASLLTGSRGDVVIESETATTWGWLGRWITMTGALTLSGRPTMAVTTSDVGDGTEEIAIYSFRDGSLHEEARAASNANWDLGALIHDPVDWNDDGYVDLAVYADSAPEGGFLSSLGMAFVWHGPLSGDVTIDDVAVTIAGDTSGGHTGWAMARMTTWEVDGPIAAVSTSGWDYRNPSDNSGRISFIPLSGAGEVEVGDAPVHIECDRVSGKMGKALVVADVDGDGVEDLLTSIVNSDGSGTPGMVVSFAGPVRETMLWSDYTGGLMSEMSGDFNDYIGWEMRNVGDVDGDGVDELWIGAELGLDASESAIAGRAYLYSADELTEVTATGEHSRFTVIGNEESDRVGSNLAFGDIDGDGQVDLLVQGNESFVREDDVKGRVALWYGPHAGTTSFYDADVMWESETSRGFIGWGLDAGDLNEDGCDDVAMSEPNWPHDTLGYGRLSLFLGGCP